MDNKKVHGAHSGAGRAVVRFKIHWHVVFTHFPVSFFLAAFGFMVLHLFTQTSCFELANYVALFAGAVAMVPTTLTGWFAWKRRYKGLRSGIFLNKIRISYAMIGVSFALVAYRSIVIIQFADILHNLWHALYFAGVVMLMLGAAAEGYYGGRLHHR